MRYGYGRVSTKKQERDGNSLDNQSDLLKEYGCDEIILEAYTGTKMDRPKFDKLLERLKPGDELVVCKLDRFARTTVEGVTLIQKLVEDGIAVNVLNMGRADNTPMGKLMITILLAFAEYERDVIVERTQAGKEMAKKRPDFKDGRPKKEVDMVEYGRLQSEVARGGITVVEACKQLGIGRTKWYELEKIAG